jgi:hypothetical protein
MNAVHGIDLSPNESNLYFNKGGFFMLLYAMITITLALIFYTIGVWSEKGQGKLKK